MASISNKAGWSIAIAVSLAFAATLAGWVHAGGPLDPPGAPGVTMKSLDEVEPRTPISALPYTISQPGSYYLTGNLSVNTAIDGITVQADDVTIDLNGFELNGNGSTSGAITQGAASPARRNWRIFGGTAVNWAYVLYAPSISNGQIDHLTATVVGLDGIALGAGARLTDCTIVGDGLLDFRGLTKGTGIATGAGSIIESCAVRDFATGITVSANSIVAGCNVTAFDGVRAAASTITGCRIAADRYGILVESGRNAILGNSIVAKSTNSGCGIANSNGDGDTIDGNKVAGIDRGVCLVPYTQATATRNAFYNMTTQRILRL